MTFGDLCRAWLLDSLRGAVAREVAQHRRMNPALVAARPPLRMRLLQTVLGERGLLHILSLYALLVGVLLLLDIVIANTYPALSPLWAQTLDMALLKDLASYYLAAQVTAIGFVFPIAVALVTLITQRENASSTNSDVQMYYSETLAYRVGASSIALSIVLAVQLVWPAQLLALRLSLGAPTGLLMITLTGFHLAWLVANFAALWHFLLTSLSFMRPVERALLRRRFAANVSIPRNLTKTLMTAKYMNAPSAILQTQSATGDSGQPSLLFGSYLGEWGEVEIASPRKANRALEDVWIRPLGWAVRHWLKRCAAAPPSTAQAGASKPTLTFAPDLQRPLREPGVICRRRNGLPLSKVEKLVIEQCFRFGRFDHEG